MKKLYFAYGSNMCQSRLERRVGKVVKIGTTRIRGFQLVFNAGSLTAYANLVLSLNMTKFVEGVVYELTLKQIHLLDNFEGMPYFYQRMIFPFRQKGKTLRDMHVYISINPAYRTNTSIIPSREYLTYLLQGCVENNLKHTRNMVKNIIEEIDILELTK